MHRWVKQHVQRIGFVTNASTARVFFIFWELYRVALGLLDSNRAKDTVKDTVSIGTICDATQPHCVKKIDEALHAGA